MVLSDLYLSKYHESNGHQDQPTFFYSFSVLPTAFLYRQIALKVVNLVKPHISLIFFLTVKYSHMVS